MELSWVRLMCLVMGQEMGLSLQILVWAEIALWEVLIDSMSFSLTLPKFSVYVFVNTVVVS